MERQFKSEPHWYVVTPLWQRESVVKPASSHDEKSVVIKIYHLTHIHIDKNYLGVEQWMCKNEENTRSFSQLARYDIMNLIE